MIKDLRFRIYGIPLVAMKVYFIFLFINSESVLYELTHWNRVHTYEFLCCLLDSFLLWQGSYLLINELDGRYPWEKNAGKRMLIQSLIVSLWALFVLTWPTILYEKYIFRGHFQFIVHEQAIILGLLFSLLITAILSGIYLFSEWKKSILESEKLKREQLDAEFEALKNQVNPHFLFNCLNTLTAIIPEDPEMSVLFVQKLSNVYRHVLQYKDKSTIDLQTELEGIESYIYLLRIRFGNNLFVKAEIPHSARALEIAPLTLQMLIENAVKHNIISNSKPLNINIYVEGNSTLVVRNNLQRKDSRPVSTSIGLQNISKRYNFIGQKAVEILDDQKHFIVKLPLIES